MALLVKIVRVLIYLLEKLSIETEYFKLNYDSRNINSSTTYGFAMLFSIKMWRRSLIVNVRKVISYSSQEMMNHFLLTLNLEILNFAIECYRILDSQTLGHLGWDQIQFQPIWGHYHSELTNLSFFKWVYHLLSPKVKPAKVNYFTFILSLKYGFCLK